MVESLKKEWLLTQEAFDLLLSLLDRDRERAGQKYEKLREALERFFEWRGAAFPEEYTDETLNRVARKISDGEQVREPHHYCLGVARLVLLEAVKKRDKERKAFDELSRTQENSGEPDVEAEVNCLTRCLEHLTSENQVIIMQYYQGEGGSHIENRRRLAKRLEVTPGTLRMRALRLRETLEECVNNCLEDSVRL